MFSLSTLGIGSKIILSHIDASTLVNYFKDKYGKEYSKLIRDKICSLGQPNEWLSVRVEGVSYCIKKEK